MTRRDGISIDDEATGASRGDLAIDVIWQAGPRPDVRDAKLARRLCIAHFGSLRPCGLAVSRSSTEGIGAVVSGRPRPLGLDVERVRPHLVDEHLLELALHRRERATAPIDVEVAFYDLWTRKEAVLKAAGVGLACDPRRVLVGWRSGRWATASIDGDEAYLVRSIEVIEGVAAAVAVDLESTNALVRVRESRVVPSSLATAEITRQSTG